MPLDTPQDWINCYEAFCLSHTANEPVRQTILTHVKELIKSENSEALVQLHTLQAMLRVRDFDIYVDKRLDELTDQALLATLEFILELAGQNPATQQPDVKSYKPFLASSIGCRLAAQALIQQLFHFAKVDFKYEKFSPEDYNTLLELVHHQYQTYREVYPFLPKQPPEILEQNTWNRILAQLPSAIQAFLHELNRAITDVNNNDAVQAKLLGDVLTERGLKRHLSDSFCLGSDSPPRASSPTEINGSYAELKTTLGAAALSTQSGPVTATEKMLAAIPEFSLPQRKAAAKPTASFCLSLDNSSGTSQTTERQSEEQIVTCFSLANNGQQ